MSKESYLDFLSDAIVVAFHSDELYLSPLCSQWHVMDKVTH
jgi:hypothetical protein